MEPTLLTKKDYKRLRYGTINCNGEKFVDQHVRKWPVIFWLILKLLGLFYHRRVVSVRRCYRCSVERNIKGRTSGSAGKWTGSFDEADYLVIMYEQADGDLEDGSPSINDSIEERESACETCQAMWWNGNRMPEVYSEEEIGVRRWNHAGSGHLSVTMLLIMIAVLSYCGALPFLSLWGQKEQILHLVLKMVFIASLLLMPVMTMCSKIVSYTQSGGSAIKLSWATALNERYLIVRAQMLGIAQEGLPGKLFLFACVLAPVLVACHRAAIFLWIAGCDFNLYMVSSSLVGIIFAEHQGLCIYLFYLTRVSFQRQLNLLLTYVKENEGDVKKCRGVLFAAASDFVCFKDLCQTMTAVVFPVVVLSTTANAIWDYLIFSDECVGSHPEVYLIELNFSILHWNELAVAIALYMMALGGLRVSYVWNNFFANLRHLTEVSDFPESFDRVLKNLKYTVEESHVLLASVIFSVFGVYAGFEFKDQVYVFLFQTCGLNHTENNFCSSG